MSKLKPIYNQLGIDTKLTKRRYRKKEVFNSIKDNTRLEENSNFMADIAEFPTAKFGNKYLLVVVDVASDEFDMQEMKNKDADTVLKAFQKILTRPYLKLPKYSLVTDNGGEFKGVFQKYLYDNSIYHKYAHKDRHKQLANVDNLIAQLSRIFNGYLNKKELETGKVQKNWTEIIPTVREELNKIRKRKLPTNLKEDNSQPLVNTTKEVEKTITDKKTGNTKTVIEEEFIKPKFKVGQMVYVLLHTPKSILGKTQPTKNFREGDVGITDERHEITEIIYVNGRGDPIRYIVSGFPYVSFSADELRSRL
jgi:hypothetical protein